jgi:hypothetical protein
VFELSEDQFHHTYMYGLKPYITKELQMHNITTMDKAQHKEKIAKNNFKRSSQKQKRLGLFKVEANPKHIFWKFKVSFISLKIRGKV